MIGSMQSFSWLSTIIARSEQKHIQMFIAKFYLSIMSNSTVFYNESYRIWVLDHWNRWLTLFLITQMVIRNILVKSVKILTQRVVCIQKTVKSKNVVTLMQKIIERTYVQTIRHISKQFWIFIIYNLFFFFRAVFVRIRLSNCSIKARYSSPIFNCQ